MPVTMTLEGPLAIIAIDRQEKLNALNLACFREIEHIIDLIKDNDQVRGALLTAAGNRAFCVGADIGDLSGITQQEASARATYRRRVFQKLWDLGKPTVAVIDAMAMGGGVELALACTFRLATRRATFSMPEIKLGLLPGAGATQRLPRLVGEARALEMMLTARRIDAEEALRIGLITRLINDPFVDARAFVSEWFDFSALAIGRIIAAVRDGAGLPLADALALEGAELSKLTASPDGLEGVAAFLEKRPAQFNRT